MKNPLIIDPCKICIEESCKGLFSCNCDSCSNIGICNKYLKPTIRITTRCTQICSHCCFECGPDRNDFMSIDMSRNISKFLVVNDIRTFTIMGGEFFCNDDWEDIMYILMESNPYYVRLVTNGDWVVLGVRDRVLDFLIRYRDIIKVSISYDKWHTNENVDMLVSICDDIGISYNKTSEEEGLDDSIVPIGRSRFDYSFYSSFGKFCSGHMYNFLIDEIGDIYKCGMGVWCYSNVVNHLDGDTFKEEFKDYNKRFMEVFVPNCRVCISAYNRFRGL